MKEYKVCFIGVGAIAKRHIRNLVNIAFEDDFVVWIDVVRRKAGLTDLENPEWIEKIYQNAEEIPANYDAIFITNPTDLHLDTLGIVQNKAKNFFIEKPITSVQKLDQIKIKNFVGDKRYYVACPLRYHPIIQYLKREVESLRVVGVQIICSSYLPEWRLGVDYRNTYSAHKDMGGGVSIDLIHEWDYLHYIFGLPDSILYRTGKKSDLEIDCEDTALYIAEYPDKFVEIHLDYFGRKPIRQILLFTDEETIKADLLSGTIYYLKADRTISFNSQRDDYQRAELRHFLKIMEGEPSDNTLEDAYRTMKLTQGVIKK